MPSESCIDDLTLATIPHDVIRMIIKSNFGENMDSLELISKTWKSLVSEFFQNLPRLEYIYLGFHKEAGVLTVCLEVCKKHLKQFLKVLPNGATFHEAKEQKENVNYRAIFRLSLGSPYCFHYLRRIFQSTNHLRLLGLANYTEEMREHTAQTMRNVEIEQIAILGKCYDDSREVIKEMITRHKPVLLGFQTFNGKRMSQREWGPFIRHTANLVPLIHITVSSSLPSPAELLQSWKSFSENLLLDGVERVRIADADNSVVLYRQPYFEFADLFNSYLNDTFPWPGSK